MKPEFMDEMERPEDESEGQEEGDEAVLADIEEMPDTPDIDLSEVPEELLQAELDRRAAGASESGKPGEEDAEGFGWADVKKAAKHAVAPWTFLQDNKLLGMGGSGGSGGGHIPTSAPDRSRREPERPPTTTTSTASLNKSQQSAVPQVAAMPSPLKPIATPVPTPVTKPTVIPPQEVTGSEVQYALAPTQPAPAPTRMQGGPAFGSMWSRLKSATKKK